MSTCTEYSPVRHLAAVFPVDERRDRRMAMLTFYGDESYSHPPAPLVYTIAGYISDVHRWENFEREWAKVLKREGIEFFHMKDFAQKKGIYETWDDKKRIKFLRTLQYIIKSNTEKDFAVSVVVADYDTLIPPNTNLRTGFGEPHVFAVIGCMKDIHVWQARQGINKPIHYVFEKGSRHDSMVKRVFEALDSEHIEFYRAAGGVSFWGKDMSPLQAADMLAYENRLEMCRQVNPVNRPKTRESLRNLWREESHWTHYNAEHITIVLESAAKIGLVRKVESADNEASNESEES
jgi:hypothetical protein